MHHRATARLQRVFLAALTDIVAHRGKHEEISRTGSLRGHLTSRLEEHESAVTGFGKRLSGPTFSRRSPVSSSFSPLKSVEINCLCFREAPTARVRGDFAAHGASISAVHCSNPPFLSHRTSLTRNLENRSQKFICVFTSTFRLDKRKIFLSCTYRA